jgi:hypothetical protein
MNNKTDFFQNRRKPDLQATLLVESLKSFEKIGKHILNNYPLKLIFLDEKITEDQKQEFLNKFYFKNVPQEDRFVESNKFNAVKKLKKLF